MPEFLKAQIRTIIIEDLHQKSFSFRFKLTFKLLYQCQHFIRLNLEEIKNILRFDFDLVSKCFEENYMFLSADKCHFMRFGKDTENETFIFNNLIFNWSNEEKIFTITIDNKLTFKSHIKILCKKAA